MSKVIIDLDEFQRFAEQRTYYNSINYADIELQSNGETVEIPSILLQKWKYIGLNTIDFISMCSSVHNGYVTLNLVDDMQNFHGS